MPEAIVVAFILCKIKGYKIGPIYKEWTIYPILFMELLHGIVEVQIFMGYYGDIKYCSLMKIFYLCSYLPLIYRFRIYISAVIGSIMVLIGGQLNDIVMAANGGKMPVYPSLSYLTGYVKANSFKVIHGIHVLGGPNAHLKFLADYFDIGYAVLSLGDIFIRLFVVIVVYNAVKARNKEVREKKLWKC